MNAPTVALVSGLAGIITGALGAGIWTGGVAQKLDDHDRRIVSQAARIEGLERYAADSRVELARILTKLESIAIAVVPTPRERQDERR